MIKFLFSIKKENPLRHNVKHNKTINEYSRKNAAHYLGKKSKGDHIYIIYIDIIYSTS